jgi:hypothetical protein
MSFFATVVSILLYGCEIWSCTNAINQKLDGAYTNLLRYASYARWTEHVTNVEFYENLPKIFNTMIVIMIKIIFAGHCSRAEKQPIHHRVFKVPKKYAQGKCNS